MNEVRYCKDCRWRKVIMIGDTDYSECIVPTGKNLVTGEAGHPKYTYCSTMRMGGWLDARLTGACGKEARFFQVRI